MATVFLTGFPGFLASALLPLVLERFATRDGAVCLVQRKFRSMAEERVRELEAAWPHLAGRIRLIEGDITAGDLQLAEAGSLQADAVEIFHLAAVYDLAVRRDLAMRVNVEGTRQVLQFAAGCPRLSRLHYVSTCYVAGRHAGTFTEGDLAKGQSFNNHYEETKYLAEVEVQRGMQRGMPVTIYRPSIVVGDSLNGATQKYDGPYFVLQWLLRQPRYAVLPMVGHAQETRFNVVPRDYVVKAIAHLSGLERSKGKVYQLCDPRPLTVKEMIDETGRATGKSVIQIPLPRAVARLAIAKVPGVQQLMKIPAEAIDYLTLPTSFTCENALADLDGSGIRCPAFGEYLPKLVEFMRAHPEIGQAAMV
jgi:thioester reductase-like protein